MFSLGVAFAADEDVALNGVDDGIIVDEDVLSVEEDSDTLSVTDESAIEADDTSVIGESSTVTKDTFFNYFNEYGVLTSDADELIFEGNFSDLPISQIMIAGDNPVKFTGNDATFTNVQFLIMQSDVTINGFNFVYNDGDGKLFYIVGEDVLDNITISNNNIDFTAVKDYDSYAIFAGADLSLDSNAVTNLSILNNIFRYVGNTNGTTINNVIRVVGYEGYYDWDTDEEIPPEASSDILVDGNTFNIQMPSVPRYNTERPQDSYFAAGLEFYYCSDLYITNNSINLTYTSYDGDFDTIDIIDVRGNPYNFDFFGEIVCEDIIVANNTINAIGHTYTYGMSISAEGIEIYDNTVNIVSEYQASGICVEAPSVDAVVRDNTVTLYAGFVTYGIYSFENAYSGAINEITVTNNTIYGDAYTTCGINLVGSDMVVSDNIITSLGNNTFGIALSGLRMGAIIDSNTINCSGSNVGMKATGDNYIPANSSKAISISGIVNVTKNNIFSTDIGISAIIEGKMLFDNNTIVVKANNGKVDNYAIVAEEIDDLTITNNDVTFSGMVDYQFVIIGYDSWGYPIYDSSNNTRTYAVFIKNSEVKIVNNNFDIAIPTFAVNWAAGRESFSEGIVLVGCDDVVFKDNNVTINTNGGTSWDTIYGIDVLNSARPDVEGNSIIVNGAGYTYAIIINDEGLIIFGNDINVTSDQYACGIDVEGTAEGQIANNNINAIAVNSAYPIYTGMNGGSIDLVIDNNNITGEAYYVVGIELAGNYALIEDNVIKVSGNHTIGIGAYIDEIDINNNIIVSDASNEGNESIWDNMGTDTTGIKVSKGNTTITNNNVQTTGDYAVDLCNNNATLTDNYLSGKKGAGNSAVANAANATITGSTPELKTVLSAVDLYTYYLSGDVLFATAKDENGDPIKNATLTLNCGGEILTAVTDDNGVAMFMVDDWDAGDYHVDISYAGNDTYGPKSIKAFISISPEVSQIVAPASATYLITAVKTGSYYTIQLKDVSDNALGGEKVTITFNGKTYTYTTDISGIIKFKIEASKVGTQKLTVKYESNGNYLPSTLTATIKITKEATKLTAAKKSFKAKVKTKKYTVTLKDSKGKAIKKAKLTLKIKGKTYKATTNAKGKAIFKIKKLTKKGTYKATVKFAGNNLYNAVSKKVKITVKK